MNLRELRGIIPTLATVMTQSGDIDVDGMRSLVRFSLEKGVHGVAVGMVAGEFYKLNEGERRLVTKLVVDEANGKVPVLVGTSHSGTEPAIELGQYAQDLGADGIVVMPPYFMKNESSPYVYEHFSRVAAAVDIPLMVQDAEEDIGVPIPLDFYPKIVEEHSNVFMVKVESLDPLTNIREIRRLMGERMRVYGAKSIVEELRSGAHGHVPSSGLPDLFVSLFDDYERGLKVEESEPYAKYERYLAFRARYPLLSANIEKEILKIRGVIQSSHVRGPMQQMSASTNRELRSMLERIAFAGT